MTDDWAKVYDKRDLDHCVNVGIIEGVKRVILLLESSEPHDNVQIGDNVTHSPYCRLCDLIERIQTVGKETVHGIPPTKANLTPCCGIQTQDLPSTDRITNDPFRITCKGVR